MSLPGDEALRWVRNTATGCEWIVTPERAAKLLADKSVPFEAIDAPTLPSLPEPESEPVADAQPEPEPALPAEPKPPRRKA